MIAAFFSASAVRTDEVLTEAKAAVKMLFFISSVVVFPGIEQLPSAAQTAADRNSSAEQPGGAFSPAQLPHT